MLPYWNWTDPAQRTLPTPSVSRRTQAIRFTSARLAGRPRWMPVRGASEQAWWTFLPRSPMSISNSPQGSGASFGGQIAAPMQFNGPHGDLESQPHDVVHVALGGLMGDPDTAAQDPIFWLHHANIDRMWNRWLAQGGNRTDASDNAWLNTRSHSTTRLATRST